MEVSLIYKMFIKFSKVMNILDKINFCMRKVYIKLFVFILKLFLLNEIICFLNENNII